MDCFSEKYSEIKEIIAKANQILSEVDNKLIPDAEDQDYYILRSHLFTENVHKVSCKHYKKTYQKVVRKFINDVNLSVVYQAYAFKRHAFDSRFIYYLFGKQGEDVYDTLIVYQNTGYSLQQKALYESMCGHFSKAFADIDKAIVLAPSNLSIRNTDAIIIFEANRYSEKAEAAEKRIEAMAILDDCLNSDKRKAYHAIKYAEFALILADEFNESSYIEKALAWINPELFTALR